MNNLLDEIERRLQQDREEALRQEREKRAVLRQQLELLLPAFADHLNILTENAALLTIEGNRFIIGISSSVLHIGTYPEGRNGPWQEWHLDTPGLENEVMVWIGRYLELRRRME